MMRPALTMHRALMMPGAWEAGVRVTCIMMALLVVGCQKPDPGQVEQPNEVVAEAPPQSLAVDSGSDQDTDSSAPSDPSEAVALAESADETGANPTPNSELTDETEETPDAGIANSVMEDPNEEPPEEAKSDYRIWIPTTAGPLLLALNVRVDGGDLSEVFEQRLSETYEQLTEASTSERLNWDSVIDYVADRPQTFGQSAVQARNQKDTLVRRYDRDKDKLIDESEWRLFLYRDVMFAEPIRVFGTSAFRYANRNDSELFSALDVNGDQEIDRDEASQSADVILRELDRDLDGCLSFSETRPSGQVNGLEPWRSRRSNRQGDVSMDLVGYVNWEDVAYSLDRMLKRSAPMSFHPVKQIDDDSSGWISSEEAASLGELSTPIRIEVDFEPGERSRPAIRLLVDEQMTDEVQLLGQSSFQLSDLTVSVVMNEVVMTDESIWRGQIRGRAAEHPDAIFAWLDLDRDQRLSSREIQASSQMIVSRIESIGNLRAQDFPDAVLIQLVRGDPTQDEMQFSISNLATSSEEQAKYPKWAAAMDVNLDGDLSESEFIGPVQAFRSLDQNGDRFLDLSELLQADSADQTQ
ncbi:MAG: EF-hand domain-containing protein [Planctomycetota bacterium]